HYVCLFIFTLFHYYQLFLLFFFSSRRRHTRFSRDWSSDVCSSDLCPLDCQFCATGLMGYKKNLSPGEIFDQYMLAAKDYGKEKRSEERRVGKECRSRGAPYH